MSVTLIHLRTTVAVARLGSLTRAADALHRSQPAITLQIKQFEELLGLKLFDRSSRRLALTTVGEQIVPILSRLLQELDTVIDTARKLQSKSIGTIRIACLPSVGANFLPRHIANFNQTYPGVSFFLHDSLGDHIVEMVKAGDVEFGITDVSPKTSDLEVLSLWEERLTAFFTPEHPLGKCQIINVAELMRHNLILLSHGSGIRRYVDTAFALHGHSTRPSCEATNNSTLVSLALAGLGVAILPETAVDIRMYPNLMARPIDGEAFVRRVAVVRIKDKTLSPAAKEFLEFIFAACRNPKSLVEL